jgi:hypothetical protein
MTERNTPASELAADVVEIDAIDVLEWEHGQRTPQASDANLAALLEESVRPQRPGPLTGARSRSVVPRGPVARSSTASSIRRPAAPHGVPISAPSLGAPPRAPAAPVAGPPASEAAASPVDYAPRPKPALLSIPRSGPMPRASSSPPVAAAVARAETSPPGDDAPGDPAQDPPVRTERGAPERIPAAIFDDAPTAPVVPAARPDPEPWTAPLVAGDAAAPTQIVTRTGAVVAGLTSRRAQRWWIAGALGVTLAASVAVVSEPATAVEAEPVHIAPPAPASSGTARGAASPPVDDGRAVAGPRPAPSLVAAGPAAMAPGPEVRQQAPVSAPERPPVPRPARRLATNKLVVEYGGPASEPSTPSLVARGAEDPAIGRARLAYLAGNQRLFAGDPDGAIAAYRRALIQYPGYVGGHRGLGLAYAQRGDDARALEAFTTYVTLVPGARDVALIKKRIVRLSGR